MSFLLSLTLHIALVLLIAIPAVAERPRPGGAPKSGMRFELVSPPSKSRGESSGQGLSLQQPGKAAKKCAEFFMGIGVDYSGLTGIVKLAPAEYPAYRAGIRIGDEILNDLDIERGNVMTVRFAHRGVVRVASIRREKICTTSSGK